jgi:hypothetical protein
MRFVVTGLAGAIKAIDPRLLNESIGAWLRRLSWPN